MKKIIIGCICATVTIVAIVALVIWFWFFRALPALDASLSVLPEVEMDSTVTMTITATNGHNQSVILDSVDIDDSFLAGFQVVTVDPEPSGTSHVPFAHQRSWDFGKAVSPRGTLSVIFTLRAVSEGHFSGDVDVCNPNQDFKTLLADVVVTEKHSNKTGAANGSQPIQSEKNRTSSAVAPESGLWPDKSAAGSRR